jgi:hypothetical protein
MDYDLWIYLWVNVLGALLAFGVLGSSLQLPVL